MLAACAKSRGQLSGFSTILILTMSALGGSVFPRFLMSAGMQKVGLVTFNAWALDGYLKVILAMRRSGSSGHCLSVLVVLTSVFLGWPACSRGAGRGRK